MDGWNQSRHVRRHRDRDRRPPRPPLPPPDHGQKHCSVPLWEKEFCRYVGNISWQRFCENKRFVGPFNNLEHWNDSGALENFQNMKERFWAQYHGKSSDVPLPDPDLYIDEVDHHCKVDPELVADLDKLRLLFDADSDSAAANEADQKPSQNQSGNWDVHTEKPAEINNWESGLFLKPPDNWVNSYSGWGDAPESGNWDEHIEKPAEINNWESALLSKPSDNWVNSNSGWGDAPESGNWDVHIEKPAEINNWESELYSKPSDNWANVCSGWGDDLENPRWHASSSNRYSSNKRNDFLAGSNNRYQDRSNMSGRKRGSRGHFQHRNSRQRNQAESYQRSGWQDHAGRNNESRPVGNRDTQNDQGPDSGYQRSGWQDHAGRNCEWRPVRNRDSQHGQ